MIYRVKDSGSRNVRKEYTKVTGRGSVDLLRINQILRTKEYILDRQGNSLYENSGSKVLVGIDKKTNTHLNISEGKEGGHPSISCSVQRSFYLPFLNHVYKQPNISCIFYERA